MTGLPAAYRSRASTISSAWGRWRGSGDRAACSSGASRGSTPREIGVAPADPAEHHVHRPSTERGRAGGGEGQRGRPAPPVGRLGHRRPLDDLGAEVAGGAHDQPGHGDPHVVGHVGDAEVDDHRVAVEHQHVAGLEVPVHHPCRVDGVQCLGQALAEAVQVGAGQGPGLLDDLVQRGAGDVAGHDIRPVALEVGVEDSRDPAVLDPPERVHLPGQPCPGARVEGDVWTQQLERHSPPAGVEREVDDPHAALAEGLEQPVGPDGHRVGHADGALAASDRLRRHAPTVGGLPG